MSSITETAARGIYQAMQSASNRAERISNSFDQSSPTANSDAVIIDIVGLKGDEQQVKANSKVLKVSQSMDQAVLDIVA